MTNLSACSASKITVRGEMDIACYASLAIVAMSTGVCLRVSRKVNFLQKFPTVGKKSLVTR
jgi:hypothetical protein